MLQSDPVTIFPRPWLATLMAVLLSPVLMLAVVKPQWSLRSLVKGGRKKTGKRPAKKRGK